MSGRRARVALILSVLMALVAVPSAHARATATQARLSGKALHSLRAPLTAEQFYFVMADRFENGTTANDKGGLGDDPQVSGFDPTNKGYYHGGDLIGLRDRLDYIKGLGTTAIWLTPSFKNRAFQPEDNSAGYHGYWITDFTQIDPHLGTNQDLAELIAAAHAKGMKVFFDIITNHTADVIKYEETWDPANKNWGRGPYVSKDESPYIDAEDGRPFDDRDYAEADAGDFPLLDADESFPYTPFVPETMPRKVPEWLNDVTLYHNRGDSTFRGESSQYGDFFGLDDLFTEDPRVIQGMIDIYRGWVRDFDIDGFRIDTVKHVNDEFWQEFAPAILKTARDKGKKDFFMFGEVFDLSRPLTSHYTTRDRLQAVLDFPFQDAARTFASKSGATDVLRDVFAGDDWYTDADSNVYELPTFLGNHDMGRIGHFLQTDNAGSADDAELLARDRLAHELLFLSRGQPVIYYGDEQGFTGTGGDQLARQDMFPSRVAEYNDDDLIGTDATTAQENFDPGHPLYQGVGALAELTRAHPALRNGAQQHRYSSPEAGIYAFSRLDRRDGHEYLVVLNNAEEAKSADIPTWGRSQRYTRIYGPAAAAARLRVSRDGTAAVGDVPALSAVVYRSNKPIPLERRAPKIKVRTVGPVRDRVEVRADVGGSSFYEVTFERSVDGGAWTTIGTDDNAPYRVFDDVGTLDAGQHVRYRATVRTNAGRTRTSVRRRATVAPPLVTITGPTEGGKVHTTATITVEIAPERAGYDVVVERSVNGGAWTRVGHDESAPAYQVVDDLSGLAPGTTVRYRARAIDPAVGTFTSAMRTVVVAAPVTTAIVHYQRPNGDYGTPDTPTGWGLHLWGTGIRADVVAGVAWDNPLDPTRFDAFGAVFEIPLTDDTVPVNFIVHTPGGDQVPATREPGGDRSFIPLDHPEIWLRAGDPTVYFSPPGS